MIFVLISKKKKTKKLLLRIALFSLLFFTNSFIAKEFTGLWEKDVVQPSELKTVYDVGIVLGGGTITYDAKNNMKFFQHNTDRITQALWLYKQGKIKKILISGGAGSIVYRNVKEANLMKEYLVEVGFNPKDIIADSISDNTHENAVNTTKIVSERFPDGKFLLITSSIHMRRSIDCFKKEGLECDIFPTNPIAAHRKWDIETLLLPNYKALEYWDKLFHELFGYLAYALVGYV